MKYTLHITYTSGREEFIPCKTAKHAHEMKKNTLKAHTVYTARIRNDR